MPPAKILRIFLFLFPLTIVGQTVEENLQYINAQFKQFNKYETSFDINESSKKIICRDKFGMYSASLTDVEFRKDEAVNSIGIYCKDESKCISSLKKDGSEGANFSDYAVELSQDGSLVANADVVLEKFSFIKNAILETGFVAPNSQISTLKYEVDLQLQKVNAIFEEHSQYQNSWYFDWDSYWLVLQTDSCKIHIPLEKITLEYHERENVQNFRHGLIFRSDESLIIKKCADAENTINQTQDYLDNLANAKAALDCFETIQKLAIGDDEPLPVAEKNIEQQLDYINDQFKKYNAFNTRFFVDTAKQELIWVQSFGESRAPLDKIDFEAEYEEAWVVIRCKEGNSKCIASTSPTGKLILHDEYSMSLKENDKAIPHLNDVVDMLKEMVHKNAN